MKCFCLCLALPFTTLAHAKQPNLLLFLADDMTYTDLGCYGNPDVKTPHIDQLAKDGLRFTRFYNSAPTCSPLRQSLYTGLYPIRNGAHPNHSRVYDGVKSLPHYLKPLGYRTAIVGKRHEAPASAFPFEMLGGSHGDGGKTPDGADLPLDKTRAFMARDAKQPWCLVVASNQPHTPWNRGDVSAYPPMKLTIPPYLVDTPKLREGMSRYYAEITYMDAQVGKVLSYLKELKIEDNTVVLWLSEQGSQLPFCKWTCYDTGIHAAAVLRWPGSIDKGITSDALISYVDVVPTFIQLAGGDPTPFKLDGRPFVPLLHGKAKNHNDVVFATNTTRGIYHGSEAWATRSATDGRWLYIRNLHADSLFQNMVTHRDAIYRSWNTVKTDFAQSRVKAYTTRPAEELFDLQNDRWCMNNLAANEIAIKAKLSKRVDAWMKQQGDKGDATERAANTRQPKEKPWRKGGAYDRQVAGINPSSPIMLNLAGTGKDPKKIDFARLPRLSSQHAVISDVRDRGGKWVNQHAYLAHHGRRYWAMWSDGPGVPRKGATAKQHRNMVPGHDQPDTRVSFATSTDGLKWTKPADLSGPPRVKGFGWIARGFWIRDGELLALASHFNAPGYPGKGLSLEAFRWVEVQKKWIAHGTVLDDTLNNFPPKKLPNGKWMMTRRDHERQVSVIVGGVKAFNKWIIRDLAKYEGKGRPEEPYWYVLPDNKLVGLIRDNGGSKRLLRVFSSNNGDTWSPIIRTNFPDATSKFFALRTSRGYYALVSNANPRRRDPLTLAISRDGLVYSHLFYLVGGRHIDYPHLIEHDGHLLIAFSGAKQTTEVLRISMSQLERLIGKAEK